MPGVIAGAFAVGFLPEYLREAALGDLITSGLNKVIGSTASDVTEFRVLLFGAALMIMMIFRPAGLLPSRRRAAELASAAPGAAIGGADEAAAQESGSD